MADVAAMEAAARMSDVAMALAVAQQHQVQHHAQQQQQEQQQHVLASMQPQLPGMPMGVGGSSSTTNGVAPSAVLALDDALDNKKPRRRTPEGRRQNLTIEQRFEICQQARADPKMTQQQLAQWAREKFGMTHEPSQTSISYALTRGKHFKTLEEAQRKLRKRRSVKQPKLDEELLKWVIDCDTRDIRISGELVKQKAQAFCEKLKIPADARPNFSNGWLASFNKRHNLKKFKRDPNYQPSDSDDEYLWRKARKAKQKGLKAEGKRDDGGGGGGASALPWNELTEDELEARKRESDLRIEGLRYDNTLKRMRVAEENMLARKRLKDAGIPQDEIDKMIPFVSVVAADDEPQTVI